MSVKEVEGNNKAVIRCAFCQGKGIDPFEIFPLFSTCCVCDGSRKVFIKRPYVRCAFCQGTGVYPGSRLSCTACGGVGAIAVPEPSQQCSHCLGMGVDPHSKTGFYCLMCHGVGLVKDDQKTHQIAR